MALLAFILSADEYDFGYNVPVQCTHIMCLSKLDN